MARRKKEIVEAVTEAVIGAIEEVGMETFKKTSLFMSNNQPIKARFPIAAMAWYAQYSDPEAGREGTIQYVRDLTPGLTEEVATEFVDKLIAERRGPELTLPKLVEV